MIEREKERESDIYRERIGERDYSHAFALWVGGDMCP